MSLETGMEDNKTAEDIKWVFFKNVLDDGEADLIESLLSTEGIPAVRKYKKEGDLVKIYMGVSRFGVDIFVPEADLELAAALVDAKSEEVLSEPLEYDNEKEARRFDMKKRGVAWALLLYIILPFIAAILLSNLLK